MTLDEFNKKRSELNKLMTEHDDFFKQEDQLHIHRQDLPLAR